ncbi:MAG: zinc ribbon domain-containing protein [Candidatus Aminicenantes bacterium]|nr:zinc ribbon domain-containing protein [Candidatus Aminicenantes bacterium]
MPIYEYICLKCQHKFECLVNLNKETKVICPKCQSDQVKRLISSFGIGGGGSRIKSGSGGCSSCSSSTCSTCR